MIPVCIFYIYNIYKYNIIKNVRLWDTLFRGSRQNKDLKIKLKDNLHFKPVAAAETVG